MTGGRRCSTEERFFSPPPDGRGPSRDARHGVRQQASRRHPRGRLRRPDAGLHPQALPGRPLGRQPLELRRPPLHARHLPPLLDRRLLQALSSASACAPSAASGSQASAATRAQASASAALRRTGRSSASAAPAICGRKASGRTGSGAPSSARRRSASASLRRAGRQGPGRSRRSPLTPLRLNRLRAGHEREIRSM